MTGPGEIDLDTSLAICERSFRSCLLTGTGEFKGSDETRRTTEAAGPEIVLAGRIPRNRCASASSPDHGTTS